MLGETVDYWLLRPFTHRRNRKTEEELDQASNREDERALSLGDGERRRDQMLARFEGRFPILPEGRYLDIGCGTGDLTLALARAGCGHLTGLDYLPRTIARAKNLAKRFQLEDRADFFCEDVYNWRPRERFDVVFSHEALEHIAEPARFLAKLPELLAPGGRIAIAFGPLFHSPFGDHMDGFFRVRIPWRGVLFSEQAILRLRRECFRPTGTMNGFREGGLNQMRYSEFLDYAARADLTPEFLSVNPQLKRIPGAKGLSDVLCRVPGLRDYIAASVYCVLR